MIIPFAAGTALLLGLTILGGKKKKGDSDDSDVTIEVPETDPDLEEAALAADPGTVPVRDDTTGEVVVVPVDDDDDDDAEAATDDDDAETIEVPATDPDLEEAAQIAEPGEVPVQDDETGDIAIVPVDPVTEVLPAEEAGEIDEETFADTLKLLEQLLAAERLTNWKSHHKADVQAWQAARGLVADGLLGPKSAALIAQETRVAPIVRYWPSGSWKGSPVYNDYITVLKGLGVDASREQGQGFGSPPKPITVFAELV